ncbi:MAG: slipin family protein [bacterium]
MPIFTTIIIVILVLVIVLKQINQYERGVKFTFGKYSGIMEPGWRVIIPIFQTYRKIDLRVKVVDVPQQEVITRDNISVKVNAVTYYKVVEADKAVLEVENFPYAIAQFALTTMRNIIGQIDLDGFLSQTNQIEERIRKIVDEATDPWGIKVIRTELKDITLPEAMKRVIGKQAEAEREKRAVIIKAEGEVVAADNIAKAANILSGSAGALHLRTLQTLNDLSSDQSNTVIFAIPLEVLRAFEGIAKKGNE